MYTRTPNILLSFVLIFPFCCFAQEPSRFILGESFFADTKIYDIAQDPDDRIWIATDDGLVSYNGKEFKKIPTRGLLSKSIFQLKFDHNGIPHCFNFNGQILKCEHDSLVPVFQIPRKDLNRMISFDFDQDNHLIVASKRLMSVEEQKIEYLLDEDVMIFEITRDFKNHLRMVDNIKGVELHWDGHQISTLPNKFDLELGSSYVYRNNDNLYYSLTEDLSEISLEQKEEPSFIKIDLNKFQDRVQKYRIYKNKFVVYFMKKKGFLIYDFKGRALFENRILLKEHKFSAFLEDRTGNLWLGTFNDGLIMIPNFWVWDLSSNVISEKDEVLSVSKTKDGKIFMGMKSGDILMLDKQNEITRIFSDPALNFSKIIAFDDNKILTDFFLLELDRQYKIKKKTTFPRLGIHAYCKVNETEAIIGNYLGLDYYSTLKDSLSAEHDFFLDIHEVIKPNIDYFLDRRTVAIHYSLKQRRCWIASSKGLCIVDKDSIHELKWKGKPIIAKQIKGNDELTFVALEDGLLVYKDDKLQSSYTKDNLLLDNKVKKMLLEKDKLFLLSSEGLQIVDYKTMESRNFFLGNGLRIGSNNEIIYQDSVLYVLGNKVIQAIKLDAVETKSHRPKVKIHRIEVNQSTIRAEKSYFRHFENQFSFYFNAPIYNASEKAYYEYQLEGYDEQWKKIDYAVDNLSFAQLRPGAYRFMIRGVNAENEVSAIASYDFRIALPYWNRWWFYLLLGVFLSLMTFSIVWLRLKQIKNKNQLLLDKKEVEKALITSRQTALRSQMNPHFLFNALNSIQEMIVMNDRKEASKFLGKFADLMRMYLNHSQEETVSLREELDALQLYLDLERVRFEDSLEVNVFIDDEVNLEYTEIPSMLLQPYVENALKHGLLHKSGNRVLNVSFRLVDDYLVCSVEDNGVGREASRKINAQRNALHQSFATKATQTRLDLINSGRENVIMEQIIDLKDKDGQASGTKVIISIPVDFGS